MATKIGICLMIFICLSACRASDWVFWTRTPKAVQVIDSTSGNSGKGARLAELHSTLILNNPIEKQAYAIYLDLIGQGASIIGIYNGWMHSSWYTQLEEKTPVASEKSREVFLEELFELQTLRGSLKVFDVGAGKPLAKIEFPTGEADLTDRDSSSPKLKDKNTWLNYHRLIFEGSNIYIFKRVLGEETIDLVHFQIQNRKQFSIWYTNWVLRTLKKGISFGLEQRNRQDINFHKNWANFSDEELVTTEVINRLNRLLNAS
jgi:hypothetical protein